MDILSLASERIEMERAIIAGISTPHLETNSVWNFRAQEN